MKRERGCGMAGAELPLPQEGRDVQLAESVSWAVEMARLFLTRTAASHGPCPLPQQKAWLLVALAWPEWAALGTALAVCCAVEWTTLPIALWRELLPTSVSVKCNPEASWDNHRKVSLRNLAFHYKYSKSLEVWTLWIFLSPFCSFVSVPCKEQLIVVKEQIYFALKKVFCFSWKAPKSHGKAQRMALNSYSQI